ncbi:hypothetical protein VNO80_23066 [Phaseolus coccineus]|uniref:Uncharacterized protein n=1 Tax=Phaseolus coccineus TaxID=3886 RepID=A0AAN9MB17_PHACN
MEFDWCYRDEDDLLEESLEENLQSKFQFEREVRERVLFFHPFNFSLQAIRVYFFHNRWFDANVCTRLSMPKIRRFGFL